VRVSTGRRKRMHRRHILIIAALVRGLTTWSSAREGLQKGEMPSSDHRVGKIGHVTITAPVKVGNATLPMGDYEVKHVSTQKEHFVEFIRVVEIPNPAWAMRRPPQGTPRYERQKIAEANCTLKPLVKKAGKTAVVISGNEASLTRLQIKGEDVAHLF
jgi:hypothetical protein